MRPIWPDEDEWRDAHESLDARHPIVLDVKRLLARMGSPMDADRLTFQDYRYGMNVRISGAAPLWRDEIYVEGRIGEGSTAGERKAAAWRAAMELDAVAVHADAIAARHAVNMAAVEGMGFAITRSGVNYIGFDERGERFAVDRVESQLWARMVGDGYAEELREYSTGNGRWRGLAQHAARHRERMRKMAEGADHLMIEGVLARALEGVATDVMDGLEALVRAQPKGPPCGGGVWIRDRLLKEGVDLPEQVEAVSVTDGLVHGRIRLGPLTTWNNGKLLDRRTTLPEAVLCALAGRPLATLIHHPLLDADAVIQSARMDGRGELRTRVATTSLRYGSALQRLAAPRR